MRLYDTIQIIIPRVRPPVRQETHKPHARSEETGIKAGRRRIRRPKTATPEENLQIVARTCLISLAVNEDEIQENWKWRGVAFNYDCTFSVIQAVRPQPQRDMKDDPHG